MKQSFTVDRLSNDFNSHSLLQHFMFSLLKEKGGGGAALLVLFFNPGPRGVHAFAPDGDFLRLYR